MSTTATNTAPAPTTATANLPLTEFFGAKWKVGTELHVEGKIWGAPRSKVTALSADKVVIESMPNKDADYGFSFSIERVKGNTFSVSASVPGLPPSKSFPSDTSIDSQQPIEGKTTAVLGTPITTGLSLSGQYTVWFPTPLVTQVHGSFKVFRNLPLSEQCIVAFTSKDTVGEFEVSLSPTVD